MCITKIEAFKDSKGGIHPSEGSALLSEMSIVTGLNPGSAKDLFGNAAKVIPLLQRYAAIQAEKPEVSAPSAEPTTLSGQELDCAGKHMPFRFAREPQA